MLVGVKVEIAGCEEKKSRSNDGPSPAPETKEAEHADDHQAADAEDPVASEACAIDTVQGGKGVQHGEQQQVHPDEGHAGEHPLELARGSAGEMTGGEGAVLCRWRSGKVVGLGIF